MGTKNRMKRKTFANLWLTMLVSKSTHEVIGSLKNETPTTVCLNIYRQTRLCGISYNLEVGRLARWVIFDWYKKGKKPRIVAEESWLKLKNFLISTFAAVKVEILTVSFSIGHLHNSLFFRLPFEINFSIHQS